MKAMITELLALQGQLDQTVLENLPEGQHLSDDFRTQRAIAMVCEFLEGADGSLEEQADFLHFILSYALEWGLGPDDIVSGSLLDQKAVYVPRSLPEIQKSTMLALAETLNLHERDWKFWKRRCRFGTHVVVAGLCTTLLRDCFDHNLQKGRTPDLVYLAYKDKHATNLRRQQTGY